MRIFGLAILLVLLRATAQSQQSTKLDSLMKVLAGAGDDTSRVRLLLTIADQYETNNQDSSIFYLEKAKALATSLNDTKGLFLYYQQLGIVLFTKGEYTSAMEQSLEALRLARQLKDSALVITILNNAGIIYGYLGEFDEQLDLTLQVKNAAEATKDSSKLGGIYHNLSNCYYNLKQYRRSIGYAKHSVSLYTVFHKKNTYINRVYATLAQNYDALQMVDSALYFYSKAIEESAASNDKYAEGAIHGYMATLYGNNNRFSEMLSASKKSLAIARELQSRQMVSSALYTLAYANLLNGNNADAIRDINESLDISTADTMRDELKNGYAVLAYITAATGDYRGHIWAKRKTDSLQEAILNEQVVQSTTEMEKKYESEKKDKQIKLQQAQLQRRRILNYTLIGAAAGLIIIAVLLFRNYSQKQRLQEQRISELETEKQLMATEAVIKGEEQERTRLAKDLHDGLGGMLSGIKYSFQTMKGNLVMTEDNARAFERGIDMLDSSIKEMRRVAHNMMPEALVKFGLDVAVADFCHEINESGALRVNYQSIGIKDRTIDQTTAITIYRIVQELINNIMKHASAGSAIVQLSAVNNSITITVEDDGKGFDPAILQHSVGIGWSNIKNRIEYLKGKVDIQSEPGRGTSVHIELNV